MSEVCPTCRRRRPRTCKVSDDVRAQVKALRFRGKLKQTAIARQLGISQASVARILAENERQVLT